MSGVEPGESLPGEPLPGEPLPGERGGRWLVETGTGCPVSPSSSPSSPCWWQAG